MATIQQTLEHAQARLQPCCSSPRLDAEVLLCQILQCDRSHFLAWPEKSIAPAQQDAFEQLLSSRTRGEPVAYLTGRREFWSLSLQVTHDTLIPRPETELLVEQVLDCTTGRSSMRIADLGTGSGAIAIAIATERPHFQLLAFDSSEAALAIARRNARQQELSNIEFIHGDWLSEYGDEAFDVIVSNPPYIEQNDPHLQQGDVAYEPQSALVSGIDGLDDIRQIVMQSKAHLRPGGRLIMEHGYNQQVLIKQLLTTEGYRDIRGLQDLSAIDRCVVATWAQS